MEKLKIENSTMAKVTSTKRIEKNLVEPIPMREALIPEQSDQDFFSCSSMPRNRELMRVFKDVGLVEQLGCQLACCLACFCMQVDMQVGYVDLRQNS